MLKIKKYICIFQIMCNFAHRNMKDIWSFPKLNLNYFLTGLTKTTFEVWIFNI